MRGRQCPSIQGSERWNHGFEHAGIGSHQYGTCVRCGHVILITEVNWKACDKSFQNKFWIILP